MTSTPTLDCPPKASGRLVALLGYFEAEDSLESGSGLQNRNKKL